MLGKSNVKNCACIWSYVNRMTKPCPKCGSKETHREPYMEISILKCKKCGYDESALYEIYPEHKTSQKAKGQFSPYKTGGSKRTK